MTNYNFWKNWKHKTIIEKKAVNAVRRARKYIIESVSKNKLVAIYIKGSFARRELNKKSDVDIVPIVTENKYQGDIWAVNDKDIHPAVVVPLSIQEFKNNKLSSKSDYSPDLRAEPDLFLKKIKEYKIIYGKPLNPKKFPIRSDKKIMKSEIKKIKEGYILAYQKGKIPFSPLLKEVFWLVELEQNVKGKKVKHSFEEIVESVKDKKHIVHEAYRLRLKGSDKNSRSMFIGKLKTYLGELGERMR